MAMHLKGCSILTKMTEFFLQQWSAFQSETTVVKIREVLSSL